jgi:hypothetical protein
MKKYTKEEHQKVEFREKLSSFGFAFFSKAEGKVVSRAIFVFCLAF